MTDKTFSRLLKEKRTKMNLTQGQMAEKMGMKLRMYQLYEKGVYDDTPADSEKRQKHLRALAQLDSPLALDIAGLQKEIARLQEVIDARDRVIEVQAKALVMAERYINSITKKVAHGTSPTKNKN